MLKPKNWGLLAIYLFCLLSMRAALATVVPNLYDVSLTSQSQSQDEWQRLVQEGLAQVLERISSAPNLTAHPQVKQAMENASDYVEQYTYEGNMLNVKYSQDLVNQLVQKLGHNVWGQRRPNVVLWLAIEDNHQRRLVGVETDPTLQAYVVDVAKKKGIPMVLPLMDLEDMAAVTVTDVWGQFPTVLEQASMRYGAQTILLGRVMHNDVGGAPWVGDWQLLTEGDVPSWKVEGKTLEEVLAQGITGVTQYLKNNANANGPKKVGASRGKPFLIGVEGIQSSADFINVENYLKSLNPVADVNIHQLLGQIAIFEITPADENGRAALEQAVTLDQQLVPSFSSSQGIAGVESTYRWIPQAVSSPSSAAGASPAQEGANSLDPNSLASPLWSDGDED